MLKLKIKHKLLLIWLGSIILMLSIMASLFEYQIGELHKQEARGAIANAVTTLHHDLELAAIGVLQSAQSLSARGDFVASINMVDRYQDPEDYLAQVFDVEKRVLAQELAQHANATGADVIALYDSKNVLAAFYLSPHTGGQGAGFITFQDGLPVPAHLSAQQDERTEPSGSSASMVLSELSPANGFRTNRASISLSNNLLILSASNPIKRQRASDQTSIIGTIIVGRVLGEGFMRTISQAIDMEFTIADPKHGGMPRYLTGMDISQALDNVPELELDGNPEPDHSSAHKRISSQSHFLGLVRMVELGGRNIYFIFAQRKDTLQSTLDTFHGTVIAVLLLTGLAVLPTGVFFLNRTIRRPVEDLVACADNLRRGQAHDMGAFKGEDEFSELAQSFQIMSTAVRAREHALTESQKSLKNAQRIAQLGNWEWNLHSGYVYFSDEIYAILGRGQNVLSHKFDNLLDCVHTDDVRALKRRISEAIEHGEEFAMEHRILLPNGTERYVVQTGELYIDRDGSSRIRATLQDITERRLLEAAKGELISTVSHELRTPLTSILGALGLAIGGAVGTQPEKLNAILSNAERNAKRLGLLIDDLLDIERLSSASMNFEFRALEVRDILTQAVDANQAYADTFSVRLVVKGDIPDVRVLADPIRIGQVMGNLLSNACKFSPRDSDVIIHSEYSSEGIAISVTDIGPGIPDSFRPYVFERFSQADQSATRQDQRGGTGLGLAITKAILDMHDGTVGFETRCKPDPGHGTTFTFTLPVWTQQSEEIRLTA